MHQAPSAEQELTEYSKQLQARLSTAEQEVKQLTGMTHEVNERVQVVQDSLKEDFTALGNEIDAVERSLKEMMARTRLVVKEFQDAVHTKEYSRMEQQVNAFKGEQFVTRREFDRLLRE